MRGLQKKLAIIGTSLFAGAALIVPFGGSVSAAAAKTDGTIGENAAVNVQTEYDCTTHTLTAEVKNKLEADITPTVKFNDKKPLYPNEAPVKPGKTGSYLYGFSGNHIKPAVTVAVDGYSQVEVNPSLNCQEPVSFQVTQASEHTVVGYLTNNSMDYPQTVILRGGLLGERQMVTLEPAESDLVSVPYESFTGQTTAYVSVSNGPNFQSMYAVDLTQPILSPAKTAVK